jgi:hypothetical protein
MTDYFETKSGMCNGVKMCARYTFHPLAHEIEKVDSICLCDYKKTKVGRV